MKNFIVGCCGSGVCSRKPLPRPHGCSDGQLVVTLQPLRASYNFVVTLGRCVSAIGTATYHFFSATVAVQAGSGARKRSCRPTEFSFEISELMIQLRNFELVFKDFRIFFYKL